MPSYQYKAINLAGAAVKGGLEAINEVDLELRLKNIGLDLISYKTVNPKTASMASGGLITRQDLINFCFDMEHMIKAGIPIIDGFRDMRDTIDSPRLREVLTIMIEDMESGRLLSECMSAHADTFDRIFVSLIRAGEVTGRLPEIFKNLADSLRWQDELASQTRRLLIYPAFTLIVVLLVIVALLVFLVPQIAQLFKSMGMVLPLQTTILLNTSDLIQHYWLPLLTLPLITGVISISAVKRSAQCAYFWDYSTLHTPIIGAIYQKIILSRFASILSLMYQSGITIIDALRICESIVGNRVIAKGIHDATQDIMAGASITEAFKALALFPPLVIRMLQVGESTGGLDAALNNVTYFYNRDVKDAVDKGIKMLGPVLTFILGGLIALIIWAVFGPVYDILGKLKL